MFILLFLSRNSNKCFRFLLFLVDNLAQARPFVGVFDSSWKPYIVKSWHLMLELHVMFDVFPPARNQLLAPSGTGVGAFEMNNLRLFLAWDHLLIFRVSLSQEMEAESIELSDADVSGASQRNERRNMNGSLGDGRLLPLTRATLLLAAPDAPFITPLQISPRRQPQSSF